MNEPTLRLNPDIRILHRKGVLFAGWLSGIAEPVQLLEFDVALLSCFLEGSTPQKALESLNSGPTGELLSGIPGAAALLGRIQQLSQSGVLVMGSGTPVIERFEGETVSLTSLDGQEPHDSKEPLRMAANVALVPHPDGYWCWSTKNRRWIQPDLGMALLMLAFVSPTPASEVFSSRARLGSVESLGRGIACLLDAGLLIRSDDKPMERPDSARKRGAPVITAKKLNGPRWQDMQADGRIPVYFTPHMENHYPLALGMIATAIKSYRDGGLLERFQLTPISYLTPQELFEGISQKFGPGIWLFSNYIWSLDINLKIANTLKAHDPRNLMIFGGPSVPGYRKACTEFMAQNPAVDIAVHGEGEVAVTELLEHVRRGDAGGINFDTEGMKEVQGLTFRDGSADGGLVTTPARTRLKEPDSIPSPYLEGAFDSYDGAVEAAIIESNRGCPFGCTFCDWGSATRQKVRKFDLDRVKQEIDWIGRNQVRVIWIADANFGMYDRDIELSEHIVEAKKKYGFPQEVVVNYTKNTTRRLVEIIKAFSAGGIISQGIISIQTTDEATLEVINRRNIKTEKYDELTEVFAEADLPLSTDLMIGLPGITPEAFDRDLQRYFDIDVSTKAYPTQLLPNSPMADPEYMEKYRIKVDEESFVISCHSFNEQELADMKAVFHAFMIADGYSVLRYVLRFLQWDHGIKAMEFLHRMLDCVRNDPTAYPHITWVIRYFVADKFMPGGWKNFFDDVAKLAQAEFNIERDAAFETALFVNELAMPDDAINYPLKVELQYDLVAWFRDHNSRKPHAAQALSSYPPGDFEVDDPDSMVSIDMDYLQYDSHQYFWELRSPTARAKSVSDAKLGKLTSQEKISG